MGDKKDKPTETILTWKIYGREAVGGPEAILMLVLSSELCEATHEHWNLAADGELSHDISAELARILIGDRPPNKIEVV